jgi:hypothetical protein
MSEVHSEADISRVADPATFMSTRPRWLRQFDDAAATSFSTRVQCFGQCSLDCGIDFSLPKNQFAVDAFQCVQPIAAMALRVSKNLSKRSHRGGGFCGERLIRRLVRRLRMDGHVSGLIFAPIQDLRRQTRPLTVSLPPWEVVCNSLIVEPFDVARQIPRMPLCKVPEKLGIRTDMLFGNLLITSAQPF